MPKQNESQPRESLPYCIWRYGFIGFALPFAVLVPLTMAILRTPRGGAHLDALLWMMPVYLGLSPLLSVPFGYFRWTQQRHRSD